MSQNTNQNNNWPARDETQDTLFDRDTLDTLPSESVTYALAGINAEAMREAVAEAHRGLFGLTQEPQAVQENQAEPSPEVPEAVAGENFVMIAKSKLKLAQTLIRNIQESSQRVAELLSGAGDGTDVASSMNLHRSPDKELVAEESDNILEGVFNGQCMLGPDGRQYNMPTNYASKSKLVEGDILKLTILSNGKFIYKQIGPIERNRIVGTLVAGDSVEYMVEKDGLRWKILTASVTYFKGRVGDEVVILVPKAGESTWAAVENIIHKS